MKFKKYALAPLFILFTIFAGTIGCDTNYDKFGSEGSLAMSSAMGCLSGPITMKATTYNMDSNIINASEQVVWNKDVQTSQPNMTNMYEMYAGVEIEFTISFNMLLDVIKTILAGGDASALMGYAKQNPLLTQFWALNKMASSVNAGTNGTWMDSDDTIDPLLGYFEVTGGDGTYTMIQYSDFGKTPTSRIDYVVENMKKVRTTVYTAGSDNTFGTKDDVFVKTTVYQYNSAGKMERAINYSDAELNNLVSSYEFEYDQKGRLLSMTSYSDLNKDNKLTWGSYSECVWNDSGETPTLDITLGLRYPVIGGLAKFSLIKFHYEFNEDGTIHRMIQYKPTKPATSANVDTCFVYVYIKNTMLNMGLMNDESLNYADDRQTTQKSHTINELVFGEE